EERERLAREIHDTLTQGLASIVLVSRAAQDALDAQDPALARTRMETVRTTAAENLDESRRFVRDLRATGG
ncbi:sensor histidine kinase, partial [Micrococcus endophyticus]